MRAIAHHAAPVSASQAPRPMIQMKARIGPVDDPLEREADRIADAVVADRFRRSKRSAMAKAASRSLQEARRFLGELKRGKIEFKYYFTNEGDTLVAGVLSAYKHGDQANMIKAYLTFRRSSLTMAKGMGAKTLRLEADVVMNTEGLVDDLLSWGYKLIDQSSSKYALEIPLR